MLITNAQRAEELIAELLAGSRIALVSDAGMPGISDPGAHLVAQAVAAGIPVIPIPGASAVYLGAGRIGSGYRIVSICWISACAYR